MYVAFDKVDHVKFESEEKTENGSSFVHHFDEKLSETEEYRVDAPGRWCDSEYAECAATSIG